jgi:hypothetical protein
MNSDRRPPELKTDSGRQRIFSTAGSEIDQRPAINQKMKGKKDIYRLTFPPRTDPADKLVFWHDEMIEEEGLCHEEEIYGGADCLCFETGGAWDIGSRSDQEDGDHGADLLPLEEEVGWLGHERVEAFEAA